MVSRPGNLPVAGLDHVAARLQDTAFPAAARPAGGMSGTPSSHAAVFGSGAGVTVYRGKLSKDFSTCWSTLQASEVANMAIEKQEILANR